VAVTGLFIYSGGKRGGNYLEWRKAGGGLFGVTVTGKNQAEEAEEEGRIHQKDHVDVTDFLYILNH